jgi:hypothetical protein
MSIDLTKHGLFGASKVATDAPAQEYDRCFGMSRGVPRRPPPPDLHGRPEWGPISPLFPNFAIMRIAGLG